MFQQKPVSGSSQPNPRAAQQAHYHDQDNGKFKRGLEVHGLAKCPESFRKRVFSVVFVHFALP
jgi:hypothetical protein